MTQAKKHKRYWLGVPPQTRQVLAKRAGGVSTRQAQTQHRNPLAMPLLGTKVSRFSPSQFSPLTRNVFSSNGQRRAKGNLLLTYL
jgi:hypothetical protein